MKTKDGRFRFKAVSECSCPHAPVLTPFVLLQEDKPSITALRSQRTQVIAILILPGLTVPYLGIGAGATRAVSFTVV